MNQYQVFADNLNRYMARSGYRTNDIVQYLGVTRSTVCSWRRGDNIPRIDTIDKLARLFGIKKSALVDPITNENQSRLKPRLGTVACGVPILAEQNIECYDDVPEFVNCDFTLKCKGDSMRNARIENGDIVCVRMQNHVENGQIAVVLIDNCATLKRVKYIDNGIVLIPENFDYEPMVFTGAEAESVKIIGLATYFISKIK